MNLPNLWYGSCSWENHTLYACKILIWRSFGHLRRKFGQFFLTKLTVLRVFDLQFPNAAMNLPNFWYGASLNFESFRETNHTVSCWYGSCSYGPLWENHTLYTGKILIWRIFGHGIAKFCPLKANFRVLGLCENSDMAKSGPFKAIFWPKFTVLRVFDL